MMNKEEFVEKRIKEAVQRGFTHYIAKKESGYLQIVMTAREFFEKKYMDAEILYPVYEENHKGQPHKSFDEFLENLCERETNFIGGYIDKKGNYRRYLEAFKRNENNPQNSYALSP